MDATTAFTSLLTAAGREDPYPSYAYLRENAPVHRHDESLVVVSTYRYCDQVLREPLFRTENAEWADRKWPGWRDHPSGRSLMAELANCDQEDHQRLRRLMGQAFTPRRVARLRPAIERLVDTLLDQLAEDGDFMAAFALPMPVLVIGELLGIPRQDRGWFQPRIERFTTAIERSRISDGLTAADETILELQDYLRDLVRQRRRAPADDLISALVAVRDSDGDRLGEEELLANLVLLYSAGYETTSNLLGNGLVALLRHPDQLARLRANPQLAPAYVEEMLRYDPPFQIATRWAAADLRIGDVEIPKWTEVAVLIGAANRDPARYVDPDRFDPDRPTVASLGFGAGAHFCIGAGLARLEAEIAFPKLLDRFPRIALAGRARRRRPWLRGYAALPVSVG